MKPWLVTIEKLKIVLGMRADIRLNLEMAIIKAAVPAVENLDQFLKFLEDILTHIPATREMDPAIEHFHYIINCSPEELLKKDEVFQRWLVNFARDYGQFLDTPESAKYLDTFINDPRYNIEEYDPGPSGWTTFNQFFARRTKPGKRPIAGACDDNIVVFPTDGVYLGCWPIAQNATISAKGVTYSLTQLLAQSPYKDLFTGGLFIHSYLDTHDYHRFHLPVSGIIREASVIPGHAFMHVAKNDQGQIAAKDEVGFQFSQTRGIVIIESRFGWVACLPIGMGHVSSVNIAAKAGDHLTKGEELGYFCYGGSDLIMLFQQDKINLVAQKGTHYKQGEQFAAIL